MARNKVDKVEYFPHMCLHGKTMFILEQKYGNDGYALWFKLLEVLGNSDGHVFNTNHKIEWEFFLSKARVEATQATAMLDLLANLDAIDATMWSQGIVWCQNFVHGIKDVYVKRRREVPKKPDFSPENASTEEFSNQKREHRGISDPEKQQSKVKESKVKESKVNKNKKDVDDFKNKHLEKFTYLRNKEFGNLFLDYLDMRKKIKRPATDRAKDLLLKQLHKETNLIAMQMLEQSITHSWVGLFPVRKIAGNVNKLENQKGVDLAW